jgi:hypothetical protein
LKRILRTVEGVKWTMNREEKKASPSRRGKPTVTDPGGLI